MQSRYKQIFDQGIRNILVNYQRTKYVKYLSSSLNISANTKNDSNSNRTNCNNKKSFTKYVLLFTSGLTCYYLLKNKSIVPSVEAAINLSGRRGQFNFISDVVEQAAPSVVYIEIKDMKRFDFFTGVPLTASNGSGFIIKEDGLILTNAHVVVNKPNSRIDVRLHDGTTHVGTLETVDLDSDLALIRIRKNDLPVMKLGKSKDMRPGEFVVAIGSPLSLSNTCTCGVISSPNRGSGELGLKNKEMVYIQTDAAITFGNSGGPLMNLDGEAIGVNSMKVTSGISFAIPIDYVKTFLTRTKGMKYAQSRRRYMGITMLTLTPQIIHELHERQHRIPDDLRHGILVWKVILDSPAHKSGLQPGDILTHINGEPVKHANEIYEFLEQNPTEKVRMTVLRFGQLFQVNIIPEDSF